MEVGQQMQQRANKQLDRDKKAISRATHNPSAVVDVTHEVHEHFVRHVVVERKELLELQDGALHVGVGKLVPDVEAKCAELPNSHSLIRAELAV